MGFGRSLLLCISALSVLSQTLVLPVAAAANPLQGQKNYYFSPPHDPISSSPPPHGHGGGSPSTPTTPSHGGSGCTPTTPSHHHSSPSTHAYSPPPSHITPATPITPIAPSPPAHADPHGTTIGPFTCHYWGSHPSLIWGVLGWWGTVTGVFGVTNLPGVPSDTSTFTIQHALTNTRSDGFGALYREAAAAFLNSLASPGHFPFSSSQIRDSFASALGSDKAAASQASLFRLANQGHLKLV